jgi:hypothetical protein
MRSEGFKRQWEQFPTGELHFCSSGFGSANMEDPRHLLQWLTSLPNLRIAYVKPLPDQPGELVLPIKSLLDLRPTN